MSERSHRNLGNLDVELARRIDVICRRFEADWRAGGRPRIEGALAQIPAEARPALRAELEALQRELRQSEETVARPEAGSALADRSPPMSPPSTAPEAPTLAPGPAPTSLLPGAAMAGIHDEATRPPRDEAAAHSPAQPAQPTLGAGLRALEGSPPTAGPPLGAGLLTPPAAGPKVSPREPTRIRYFGDYELLRELARGGMGIVFVARQISLNRPVALKMILAGQLADDTDVKRFYLEAEAAANLDHPGIVPIYEVGRHEGQHYFSMGFVEGQSLSHRLAGGPLPPRAAAALLVKVTEAIAYAHHRGIIHRDLKPANILIDTQGNPRVTDFGLAKKVQGDSGLTGSGQIMGTPSYMPPEQAGGNRVAVGPASDGYALGATLYALITGRPPFQAATAMDTLLQVLSDEPVPPRRLNATIPRDLETICLKCLEKEPGKRYASAVALAEDLRRFLGGEPITARPVGQAERTWRWCKRNPWLAGALVSAAGLLVAVVGLQARANGQLRSANAATAAALAQSEESRKQAETVSQFLVEAFRSPDPAQDGRTIKMADVLEEAARKLDQEFTGSPATRGALLNTLGTTYLGLGLYDRAASLLTQAAAVRETVLGADHPLTLTCRSNLAFAYWAAGRVPESIALNETTLKRRQAALGPDHPDTLASRNNLAIAYGSAGRMFDAIALDEVTLRLRQAKLGPDHPDTLRSRNNLAIDYWSVGRMLESIALDEATLERMQAKLGIDHPDTLKSRHNLAASYYSVGRLLDAIALDETTLELREAKLGIDHPDTLKSRQNLALSYAAAGRLPAAIALHEATLEAQERVLGPAHPEAFRSRYELARAYKLVGRWDEAERLGRDTLARHRKADPPDGRLLAVDLAEIGSLLLLRSRWSEAESFLRESLAIREKLVLEDWERYHAMSLLGGALLGQGRHAQAEPLIVPGYQGLKAREAGIALRERPLLREAAERVVRLYEDWGKPESAATWKAKLGMPDLPVEVFAQP
jgi:tetratricopeptide (TPR) repeat protein